MSLIVFPENIILPERGERIDRACKMKIKFLIFLKKKKRTLFVLIRVSFLLFYYYKIIYLTFSKYSLPVLP